jgi:hypothetical protein
MTFFLLIVTNPLIRMGCLLTAVTSELSYQIMGGSADEFCIPIIREAFLIMLNHFHSESIRKIAIQYKHLYTPQDQMMGSTATEDTARVLWGCYCETGRSRPGGN